MTDAQIQALRTALLAFAGIALFVGAFLIFNTFSILVGHGLQDVSGLLAGRLAR